MATRARTVSTLALIVASVLVLGSCGPKFASREARSAAPAPSAPASMEAKDASAGGQADAVAPGTSDEAPARSGAVGQRRIITTGTMTIEVISLDKALADLTALVNANGGFFANKSVSAESNWRSAELVVRIPAAGFDKVHEGAKGLGTVKREEQQGEDVTKQWQDLEARLKIRKQEEQSLVEMMKRQARLSDLLEVEKRLWEVREQIERAEGELRYLRDQVTLATLTITLNEQVPVGVETIGRWNLGYHLLQAIYAMGRMFRGLIIGIIYVALPGAVIWVPLLLLFLWLRRRIREARARRQAPPPPPAA